MCTRVSLWFVFICLIGCSKGAERKVCVRKTSVKQGFDAEDEGGAASGSGQAQSSAYEELARAMPMGSCNAADLSPFVLSQEAQGVLTSLLLQVLSSPLPPWKITMMSHPSSLHEQLYSLWEEPPQFLGDLQIN